MRMLSAYLSFRRHPVPASRCAFLSTRRSCASLSTRMRPLRRLSTATPVEAYASISCMSLDALTCGFRLVCALLEYLFLTSLADCRTRCTENPRKESQYATTDLRLTFRRRPSRISRGVVVSGVLRPLVNHLSTRIPLETAVRRFGARQGAYAGTRSPAGPSREP